MKQLILGGARSGKSRLAEAWVQAHSMQLQPTYVATAHLMDCDNEMTQRIKRHQQDRAQNWNLREEPLQLGQCLRELSNNNAPVLVDCLTLWLSNCLAQGVWLRERSLFVQAVADFKGSLVLVSNETGLGVVPMGELTRQFVDESGLLHQTLAAYCDRVVFTVAGLPWVMKGEPWRA